MRAFVWIPYTRRDESGCGSVLVQKYASSLLQALKFNPPFGLAVSWSYSVYSASGDCGTS